MTTIEAVLATDLDPGDVLYRDGREITVTCYPAMLGTERWLIHWNAGTASGIFDVKLREQLSRIRRAAQDIRR